MTKGFLRSTDEKCRSYYQLTSILYHGYRTQTEISDVAVTMVQTWT